MTVQPISPETVEVVLRWRHGLFNVVTFAAWLLGFVASLIIPFVDDSAAGLGDPLTRAAALGALMLVLGYAPIAMVANRTVFTLRGPHASIRHAPLWWPSTKRVSLGGMTEFVVRAPRHARSNSSRRVLLGLNAQHQWVALWRFNGRIVPRVQMQALCRVLEWHVSRAGSA